MNLSIYAINYTKEGMSQVYDTPSLAEREGFEPPVPLGTTVFKTVVIDHSTISPNSVWMTIAWFS